MYEYHFFNELSPADYPETKAKTIEAETEDTRIVERMMYDELSNNPIYTSATATRMPLYEVVDLEYVVNTTTGNTYKFAVEVKSRCKTNESVYRWPYAPLRVDKVQNLQGKAKMEGYDALYYIVLLSIHAKTPDGPNTEHAAYIYDLLRVDWSRVELKPWTVNIDNQRPELGKKTYDTYFLPLQEWHLPHIIIKTEKYYNANYHQKAL